MSFGFPTILSLFGDNRGLPFSVRQLRLAHFFIGAAKQMKNIPGLNLNTKANYTYEKYRKVWAESADCVSRLIMDGAAAEPLSLSEIKRSWREEKNGKNG